MLKYVEELIEKTEERLVELREEADREDNNPHKYYFITTQIDIHVGNLSAYKTMRNILTVKEEK